MDKEQYSAFFVEKTGWNFNYDPFVRFRVNDTKCCASDVDKVIQIFNENTSIHEILKQLDRKLFILNWIEGDDESYEYRLDEWVLGVLEYNDAKGKLGGKTMNRKYVDYFKKQTGWDYSCPPFDSYWVRDNGRCNYTGSRFDRMIEHFKGLGLKKILEELDDEAYLHSWFEENPKPKENKDRYFRFDEWINGVLDRNKERIYEEIGCDDEPIEVKMKISDSMGLKIKKTESMTIDEFKECMKAYDKIIIKLDSEKIDEYKKDYGKLMITEPIIDSEIELTDETIEFMPKALNVLHNYSTNSVIDYDLIDEVIGEYYLTTKQD